jgi:hypothetical protein
MEAVKNTSSNKSSSSGSKIRFDWVNLKTVSSHKWFLQGIVTLVMILSTLVIVPTDFGSYLNQYLFRNPIYKYLGSVNKLPKLDPRVRLVTVEDNSLQFLGRFPTIGEWQAIADKLFEHGVEKIFLISSVSLKSENHDGIKMKNPGEFYSGVALLPLAKRTNARAVQLQNLPPEMFIEAPENETKDYELAKEGIVQNSGDFSIFNQLGHTNVSGYDTFELGRRIEGDRFMPSIAFSALNNLKWKDGQLHSDDYVVPAPADRKFFVDYIDYPSVMEATVPIGKFFDRMSGYKDIKFETSIMDRFDGVKYVVFVREAYLGSRFTETPVGNVPTYLMLVSNINSVLNRHLIHRPYADVFYFVPMFLVFIFLLSQKRNWIAIHVSLLVIAGSFGACVWLMLAKGWMLPAATMIVVGLMGWATRVAYFTAVVINQKKLLHADLEMGRSVQNLFLQRSVAGTLNGWEFKFHFKPYGAMSGDWIQTYRSPDGSPNPIAVFAIGDVVGKGPSAALNTAVIAGVWNHFTELWDRGEFSMEEFVRQLNRVIKQTFHSNQNTTLSIAAAIGNELHIASCGAPSWIKVQPGTGASNIRSTPYDPIGMQASDTVIRSVVVNPGEGDIFVAHTDGVMEGSKIRKQFLKTVPTLQANSTNEMFDGIIKLASEIGKDEVLPDDVTMILIRRIPTSENQPAPILPFKKVA